MKNKYVRTLLAGLVLVLLCTSGITVSAYAETDKQPVLSQVDAGIYDDYTVADMHDGLSLIQYGEHYGQKTMLEKRGAAGMQLTVTANDDITKFIPQELFTAVDTTLYIGEEYGFLIDCFEVNKSNCLHSVVMLFDISYDDNVLETFNHLKITVTPVFQAEFAYTPCTGTTYVQAAYTDGTHTLQDTGILVQYPESLQGQGCVFAVPTLDGMFLEPEDYAFTECSKYYLTNVASVVSLYNTHHANAADSGYVLQEDDGAFFSQFDYEYKGKFMQPGETGLSEIGDLAWTVASVGLDMLGSLVPGGSALSSAIKLASGGMTVTDVVSGIAGIEGIDKAHLVTAEKTVTYSPEYTVKDLQIQKGYLTKDAVISAQAADGKKLLYGKNDFVQTDYQISHTDFTWETSYVVMLSLEVTTVSGNSKIAGQSVGYKRDLEQGIKEFLDLDVNAINENYIFLDDTCNSEFTVPFTGEYSFNIDAGAPVIGRLYETNGETETILGQTNYENDSALLSDILLEAGKTYRLYTAFENKQLYGSADIRFDFTPPLLTDAFTLQLEAENFEFFSFVNDKGTLPYRLPDNGMDIELSIYDETLNLVEDCVYHNGDVYEIVFPKNGEYYLQFSSTIGVDDEFLLTQAREISVNTETPIGLSHKTFLLFTAPVSGTYTITNTVADTAVYVDGVLTDGQSISFTEGQTYVIMLQGSGVYHTGTIAVEYDIYTLHYGQTQVENIKGDYILMKFTPAISAHYRIYVGGNFTIQKVYVGSQTYAHDATQFSAYLDANSPVFISVKREALIDDIEVNISVEYEVLTMGDMKEVTLNGNGEYFVKVDIDRATQYDVTCDTEFTICDYMLQPVSTDNVVYLAQGVYYLQIKGTAGAKANIMYTFAGEQLENSANIVVNGTRYFKFYPEQQEYIFETYGDLNLNINTSIVVHDVAGNVLAQTDGAGFHKLYFDCHSIADAQCIFITTSSDSTNNYGFRILYADGTTASEITPLNLNSSVIQDVFNNTIYIKLNAANCGNKYLYIEKFSTKTLYVQMWNSDSYSDLTNLSTDAELMKFVIDTAAYPNAILAVGTNAGELANVQITLIDIYDTVSVVPLLNGVQTNEIVKGYEYSFALQYEYTENGITYQNFVPNSVISGEVFSVECNGIDIVNQENEYSFLEYDFNSRIVIDAVLFDYNINSVEYTLLEPFTIDASVNVSLNEDDAHEFVLRMDIEKRQSIEVDLSKMSIYAKLFRGSTVLMSGKFTEAFIGVRYLNIDRLVWEMNFTAELTVEYSIGNSSVSVVRSFDYSNIPQNISGENTIVSVDDDFLYFKLGNEEDISQKIVITNPNLRLLNIEGVPGKNYRNFSIEFDGLDFNNFYFLINLKNVSFTAQPYTHAISIDSPYAFVTIAFYGNVKVQGGVGDEDGNAGDGIHDTSIYYGLVHITLQGKHTAVNDVAEIRGGNCAPISNGKESKTAGCGLSVNFININDFNINGVFSDNYKGLCIYGGNAEHNDDSAKYTAESQVGIYCEDTLSVADSIVNFYGGNGGNGHKGADGTDGRPGDDGVNGSGKNWDDACGKPGTDGGDGQPGGHGSNGSNAIFIHLGDLLKTNSILNAYGGSGGNGGDGGNGGRGGDGGNGANTASRSGSNDGGRGGDGGNGGNGGCGGKNGGNALASNRFYYLLDINEAGQVGIAGKGGDGGNGGNGGKGGADTRVSGHEGSGGDAGDGGDSGQFYTNGTIGTPGSAGTPGKKGDAGGYGSKDAHDGAPGSEGNQGSKIW